jgi:hypothetical protein
MLSEDFQVSRFGVESDFCVGPVAEGLLLEPPHLHKAVKILPSK